MRPRDAVYWFDRKEPPLPPLHGRAQADAVVIGGGMMGLMCALKLAQHGRSVCLVEANTCGAEASGRSSGFITPDSELELTDLVDHFGREDARRVWEFARGGVESIRAAIEAHQIDADVQRQDSLFVAAKRRGAKILREEHETHQSFGYASTLYERARLPRVLGAEEFHGGFRFGGTFGIDGYRCCLGLRRAAIAAGVRVFEQTRVTGLTATGVDASGGTVRAGHVAVCVDRFLPTLGLALRDIYHAQTFLGITEPLAEAMVRRMFPDGPVMVWDTSLVYGYFRLAAENRLLVGGSTLLATYAKAEQHRPEAVAQRLTRYLRRHFPDVPAKFNAVWPGLIGISKDFAPVVGRHREHRNVVFAGGAAGLPSAAALGRYLAEKIIDGRSDLDALLSVERRFPIGRRLHAVLGDRAAFALAHGRVKFIGP